MKKIIFAIFIILVSLVFFIGATNVPVREMCHVSAKHAVIVELTSARLISGKNHFERTSMASTTKIMTALLLCETADLDKEITVTESMVKVEGTSMGLMAGDRVDYRDLLYGLLLASGNDAANATAISLAGSIHDFAVMMNNRAKQIGMKNTNFVTPSGLDDDNHYSTAYDMALLACEAMKNPEFAKACSSQYTTVEYGNPPFRRRLKNHNKLLKMYEDCVGIKTGFTKKSGRCLVSCAVKDGKGIVAVTLNAPDDWNDHIRMLDYGMNQLESRKLTIPNIDRLNVIGGLTQKLELTAKAPTVSLLPEDFEHIKTNVRVQKLVFAPIDKSESIGYIEWELYGKVIAAAELKATNDIDIAEKTIKRDIKYWIKQLISA